MGCRNSLVLFKFLVSSKETFVEAQCKICFSCVRWSEYWKRKSLKPHLCCLCLCNWISVHLNQKLSILLDQWGRDIACKLDQLRAAQIRKIFSLLSCPSMISLAPLLSLSHSSAMCFFNLVVSFSMASGCGFTVWSFALLARHVRSRWVIAASTDSSQPCIKTRQKFTIELHLRGHTHIHEQKPACGLNFVLSPSRDWNQSYVTHCHRWALADVNLRCPLATSSTIIGIWTFPKR